MKTSSPNRLYDLGEQMNSRSGKYEKKECDFKLKAGGEEYNGPEQEI